ncbi:unnamed protein product [Urochloa humidicola]
MLMFGRFVAGVGVGYAIMIAPVYTAEISPAAARGFLTSFPEVFINIGILLGYVSNYAFMRLPLHLGWRVMLGIGAVPSALLALMVFGMPESPRWLVMKGRLADARAVLEKTSDTPEEAAARLADIKAAAGIPKDLDGDVVAIPKERNGETKVWKELILSPTPAIRRILLSAVGLHFFQQASGIDSVVLYSPRVFKSAGITDDNKLLGTTCAVGVTKTLFILVATFLLDRAGRRPLLLTSTGGMIISLIGLGTGLTVVGAAPGRQDPVGRGVVHLVHPRLRVVLLDRARAHDVRVHLGDLPAAGARTGVRRRRGVQPRHQRRDLHDVPVPVESHHHRRQLLPLLRHRRARVGVLLHLPPGDSWPDAGGDGQAVRHGRYGRGWRRERRWQGESGGNAHELDANQKQLRQHHSAQFTLDNSMANDEVAWQDIRLPEMVCFRSQDSDGEVQPKD